jgi:hypothetical protein
LAASARKISPDRFDNTERVAKHVVAPEPDHTIAGGGQLGCALCICPLPKHVPCAIDLDREFAGRAGEIDEEAANRMLSAKSITGDAVTQNPS